MFRSVHHVHFVVNNRDEIVVYVVYMEKYFGMKPEKIELAWGCGDQTLFTPD